VKRRHRGHDELTGAGARNHRPCEFFELSAGPRCRIFRRQTRRDRKSLRSGMLCLFLNFAGGNALPLIQKIIPTPPGINSYSRRERSFPLGTPQPDILREADPQRRPWLRKEGTPVPSSLGTALARSSASTRTGRSRGTGAGAIISYAGLLVCRSPAVTFFLQNLPLKRFRPVLGSRRLRAAAILSFCSV